MTATSFPFHGALSRGLILHGGGLSAPDTTMHSPRRIPLRLLALDLTAGAVFYAGTLGLRVVERTDGADASVTLEREGGRLVHHRLVLTGPGRANERSDVVDTFTLLVEEVEEMRTLCVMADLTGGQSEEPKRLADGRWEAVLTDPSGNRVRLVQPLPGTADRRRSACRSVPGRNLPGVTRAGQDVRSPTHAPAGPHARSV